MTTWRVQKEKYGKEVISVLKYIMVYVGIILLATLALLYFLSVPESWRLSIVVSVTTVILVATIVSVVGAVEAQVCLLHDELIRLNAVREEAPKA